MIFSMIIARSFNKTWSESRLMINSIASHRITLLMILMIIMKMIHHILIKTFHAMILNFMAKDISHDAIADVRSEVKPEWV